MGQRLVDGHRCTDTEVDGGGSAEQEDSHRHRTAEGVLELVEALNERNKHQTERNQSLESNSKKLVGNNPEDLENGIQIPLRKNFQRCCERICLVAEHGWVEDGETDDARNRAEDHDREDVEQVVRPGGFAVIF